MGTGLPFIFQVVLLLFLPLAVAYLFTVVGVVLILVLAALKDRSRRENPDSAAPSALPQ